MLSEFLIQKVPGWEPPQLHRQALVQPHCHHLSVVGFSDEEKVLTSMGLELQIPDAGCCGMAGSFGYEAGERFEVSIGAGERVLFPEIRRADPHTILVADGFSCRSQIRHGTGRRALHLAQVIQMAIDDGTAGPTSNPTERKERQP
jgi:Fe-S oxidoreductase